MGRGCWGSGAPRPGRGKRKSRGATAAPRPRVKSRQPLDWFDRALVPLLGYAAAAVMLFLMLLTCVDVVGRYFLNKPLTGGFELTEVLLASLIFAGLPLVTLRGDHITVDLFDPVTPDWLFP